MIQRFGVRIYLHEGSKSRQGGTTGKRRPQVEDHPEGIAKVTAREGLDLYLIAADGYPLAIGDVAWDVAGEPLQTVRLAKGAGVSGRVLRENAPLEGAVVTITGSSPSYGSMTRTVAEQADRENVDFIPQPYNANLNRRYITNTDAQGNFALRGLEPGLQRVQVSPQAGAALALDPFSVGEGEQRDLGDLRLRAGAQVRGRVLLPPGILPAGLEVYHGDRREGLIKVLDAQGNFTFDDLSPGRHTFSIAGRSGVLESGAKKKVTLESGDEKEIELDARRLGVCHLSLEIQLQGVPAPGLLVSLVFDQDRSKILGRTDAAGRVEDFVRARGDARVHVSGGVPPQVHPTARLLLTPSGKITETLNFATSRLTVQMPDWAALPENATLTLQLQPTGSNSKEIRVTRHLLGGKPSNPDDAFVKFEPGKITYFGLPTGPFRMTFQVAKLVAVEPGDRTATSKRGFSGREGFWTNLPAHLTEIQAVHLLPGEEYQVTAH